MTFAIITGVISAINGALNIAKAFATQSAEIVVGSGKGTGFWKFYSNSYLGTKAIAMNRVPEYIDKMVDRITKEASPALARKKNDLIDYLQAIKEFDSYVLDECNNMVNVVDYSKSQGTLFFYITTFSPFIHSKRGEGCKIETISIKVDMKLAKDWMIIQKAQTSFFRSSCHDEIQYLNEKGMKMSDVVEAISVAMAPAVLGLIKLPKGYMKILDTMFKEQQAHPERGTIKGPTPEQQAQAYQNFKNMQDRQDKYEENAKEGFKALGNALSLGLKGPETEPPLNDGQ